MTEEKVACRTPAEGRDGVTNIPKWKYDLMRGFILEMVRDAGPDGMPFSKMKDALQTRMSTAQARDLGSAGWHVTVVKLNMEVQGELVRVAGKGPQRIVLAPSQD